MVMRLLERGPRDGHGLASSCAGLLAACFIGSGLASDTSHLNLKVPQPGDHTLFILSPNLLELSLVNTKQPDPARVDSWDWVDDQGSFIPPDSSRIKVVINGQTNSVAGVGFRRRPLYAPLLYWDLKIGNHLFLQ